MKTTSSELLIRNFNEIFIELDPLKRAAMLAEVYTEDCLWVHPGGQIVGREGINEGATEIRKHFPEYRYTITGEIQTMHNVATCRWGSGMPGQPFPLLFSSRIGPSRSLPLAVTQLWRVFSETLRADYRGGGLCTKSTRIPSRTSVGRYNSHAKTQRKLLKTRQCFASLRLCVRHLLRSSTFYAKPWWWSNLRLPGDGNCRTCLLARMDSVS